MVGSGSLTVVGCGIVAPAHVTSEARAYIVASDCVLSLVADPIAAAWLTSVNPQTRSLTHYYEVGKARRDTYEEIVAEIVETVRSGQRVCAVTYGHPGVYAYALHESVRRVRVLGLNALMLPGVSADACLFAELGIDPAHSGLCSFEASDFLMYDRHIDTTATLILWQIGVIGERSYKTDRGVWNIDGVRVLIERLCEAYPPDHEVTVYQAARFITERSTIARLPLHALASAPITPLSTLVILPATARVLNRAIYNRLTASA